MKKILVLCTGNSCRSQMAEAYLKFFAGHKAAVFSAGIEKHGLNPRAVNTMKEDNMDISMQTSNLVEEYIGINFDYIITVCDHANEQCPVFPGPGIKFHHNFADPAKAQGTEEEIMVQFRKIREEIKLYCKSFVAEQLE